MVPLNLVSTMALINYQQKRVCIPYVSRDSLRITSRQSVFYEGSGDVVELILADPMQEAKHHIANRLPLVVVHSVRSTPLMWCLVKGRGEAVGVGESHQLPHECHIHFTAGQCPVRKSDILHV